MPSPYQKKNPSRPPKTTNLLNYGECIPQPDLKSPSDELVAPEDGPLLMILMNIEDLAEKGVCVCAKRSITQHWKDNDTPELQLWITGMCSLSAFEQGFPPHQWKDKEEACSVIWLNSNEFSFNEFMVYALKHKIYILRGRWIPPTPNHPVLVVSYV
ncbi:uncharacterized protein LOC128342137 isoform X3 [Hemicordylus capensis]|uniref:uncharacterized protein LOC128342137 isoform X3 n=1 Tax=Hemicordylus capensis TaxID=884348 RepID=UPI002302B948|nr:uncharacterized protein LOC128342137 isoform X3 [Hemicordylus capensis]